MRLDESREAPSNGRAEAEAPLLPEQPEEVHLAVGTLRQDRGDDRLEPCLIGLGQRADEALLGSERTQFFRRSKPRVEGVLGEGNLERCLGVAAGGDATHRR